MEISHNSAFVIARALDYYAEHMEDTASREKSQGMTKSAEFLDYEANEARKARAQILDSIGLQQDNPAAVPVKFE